MSYAEFSRRRKSSKYNLGDRVYFEDISGYNSTGLPVSNIRIGIVVDLPDEYSAFYGIEPMDADSDTFCMISVLAQNMRKVKRGEIA